MSAPCKSKFHFVLFLALIILPATLYCQDSAEVKIPYGDNVEIGKFADINGIQMYYEVYGAGQPLVMIHGNGGNIKSLQSMIPYFSEHYQVIVADSRGHGKTGLGESTLTYEQMAEDWASLLDYLDVDSVNLIGISDGAIIGLLLAIHNPSKIRMLAAMGANLRPDSTAIYSWASRWLDRESNNIEDLIAENDTTADWRLIRRHLNLMDTQPNIPISDLAKISAPVLVMVGDKDAIRLEHAISIFEGLPKAHLCVFPGGTHFVPKNKAELFNKMVYDFFINPFTRPETKNIIEGFTFKKD